jgi:AmmeMemoRadiSam system protein A
MADSIPKLPELSPEEKQILLRLARQSIEHGLNYRRALEVDARQYPPLLQEPWGVFVTLHLHGKLRGCIGTLQARDSLVANVAEYAYLAAFRDSRFNILTWDEFPDLHLQISLLSQTVPLAFETEDELLSLIEPGVDGLVLDAGYHRGTFLPSVWEQLPEKKVFWSHLKEKSGLPADFWSNDVRVSRYRTACMEATAKELA